MLGKDSEAAAEIGKELGCRVTADDAPAQPIHQICRLLAELTACNPPHAESRAPRLQRARDRLIPRGIAKHDDPVSREHLAKLSRYTRLELRQLLRGIADRLA